MVNIKYSQNFFKNKNQLSEIINKANISKDDIVLDIGAGSGNITEELTKYTYKVIAYELDSKYFNVLKQKYPNITVINQDFLESKLPNKPFKVFSNIPFSLTSDIVNKLTDIGSKMNEGYLFVQKESAYRYMGIPLNTQISAILSYRYLLSIIDEFNREDFRPVPNVDIVLLRIKKREAFQADFSLYRDFVTYIFNQRNANVIDTFKEIFTFEQLKHIKKDINKEGYIKPSDIPAEYYLEIFKYFKTNGMGYEGKAKGYYDKHTRQHLKREKIHRTRT